MAAPTVTNRGTPAGERLPNGYQSFFAFSRNPTISLWEMELTPPGIDGGDPVQTSTQHNEEWETMAPAALKTLTEHEFTAAYDPRVYDDILDLINQPDSITNHFPDTSSLVYWGYLKSFEPDSLSNGEMPQASCTIVPTNTDPTTGEEEPPVYTAGTGTGPHV